MPRKESKYRSVSIRTELYEKMCHYIAKSGQLLIKQGIKKKTDLAEAAIEKFLYGYELIEAREIVSGMESTAKNMYEYAVKNLESLGLSSSPEKINAFVLSMMNHFLNMSTESRNTLAFLKKHEGEPEADKLLKVLRLYYPDL